MRARMALVLSRIECEVHEVDFKNKPDHLLEISPKGTVPVLQMKTGEILEESLDILRWALAQNDPQNLLDCESDVAENLISQNDGSFKHALDRYKYPNRYPDEDCSNAREDGVAFLSKLNERLLKFPQLMGKKITYADIAIFPFIRQFANVDKDWFNGLPLTELKKWLSTHLESDLFENIVKKQEAVVYSLL